MAANRPKHYSDKKSKPSLKFSPNARRRNLKRRPSENNRSKTETTASHYRPTEVAHHLMMLENNGISVSYAALLIHSRL